MPIGSEPVRALVSPTHLARDRIESSTIPLCFGYGAERVGWDDPLGSLGVGGKVANSTRKPRRRVSAQGAQTCQLQGLINLGPSSRTGRSIHKRLGHQKLFRFRRPGGLARIKMSFQPTGRQETATPPAPMWGRRRWLWRIMALPIQIATSKRAIQLGEREDYQFSASSSK